MSTFAFTLPIVPPPIQLAEKPVLTPATEQIVLLLVSSPSTGERQRSLLSRQGLTVQQSLLEPSSIWQSSLQMHPPDIIVLNISEASDTGWSTFKAIKGIQASKNIPILFYSSSPDGDAILNLYYLTKPIELHEMPQALDQVGLISDPDHPVRTFLIVDDEPDILDLHARIVQSQYSSNRVLKATNGLEALGILQKEHVDLVLLDLQMPEMDPGQCARETR